MLEAGLLEAILQAFDLEPACLYLVTCQVDLALKVADLYLCFGEVVSPLLALL